MQPSGKHYEVGETFEFDLKGQTIFQVLLDAYQICPDKTALVQSERQIRLSYADLYEQATAFAAGCAQLGLREGDKMIVCLPNWTEYIITLYAAALAGWVLIPVNPRLQHTEIEFIVKNSEAKAAVVGEKISEFVDHYEIFNNCQSENMTLQYIISVAPNGTKQNRRWMFDEILKSGGKSRSISSANISPGDMAAIVYTSGTTGVPKGAMLTHAGLLFSGNAMNMALENSDKDVVLVVVPVCHVFGLALCIMAVASKSTVVLMERFDPVSVFEVVEREKVTVHHGVSTMFVLELNHQRRGEFDLSSLRTGIVAAAPCPYEIVERIRTELGLNPILSYGMTETSPALTASHFENEAWVYTTVGKVLPGVTLRVVDESGNSLQFGEVGELVCKTPGLMLGYYENEEANRKAIDSDGWFHTGDLVTLSESGYVTLVGRMKEMINRGGLKIYPKEVEELICQQSAVQEVAVIGVPDPVLGERSCACITLKEGCTWSPDEVRAYCKDHLADYKVPDFVDIMDTLPLNSSGKIFKMELKTMMQQQHPAIYQSK